jgi:hypothetical protein
MLSDHKILLSRELMVDSIENVIDISEEIWKELEASYLLLRHHCPFGLITTPS